MFNELFYYADYIGVSTSLVFRPMDTEECFNITILHDGIARELDETVILDLTYFDGFAAQRDHSTVTIVDDDKWEYKSTVVPHLVVI